jgi:hypothetical protein
MALINAKAVSFNEIRVIICVNGYTVKNEFVVREIGFWSRNINSVIPFSSRITYNSLSSIDKTTINYLLNAHHGIGIKKQPNNGLLPSETCGVIKSIYHMCSDKFDDSKRIYIGYADDLNALQLLHKAGLSHLAINVKKLFEIEPPSNAKITEMCHYGKGIYSPCSLHEDLMNQMPPLCAKVKSLILAEWIHEHSIEKIKPLPQENVYDEVNTLNIE